MKNSKRKSGLNRKLIAVGVAACFAAKLALAEPSGPAVVNGTVSFQQTGNLLQITNSPNAIINWQSFSIGASEITRFVQQSASSAVLNRVISQNPSSILGALQSNGRVFLINPNGIVFGAGARIDVSGLVASTLNLSNQDFIAGRLNFVADPAKAAAVVNQGRIAAGEGGRVYLVGSAVDNQGVITAPNGEILLAAGNSVRVTESPGSRLQVEIAAPADSAVNLSEAVYDSRGIYGGLVRNSGVISAYSAVRRADGRIVLKASKDATLEGTSRITANGAQGGSIAVQAERGTLLVDGTIEATGSEAKGGTVRLLGEQVGLVNAVAVDASGKTGGGTILIGGDYQGNNPEIQNASRTYVGPDAIVRADATVRGDGGKVIVWADGTTRYFGTISAKGGALSGNGGFVETSGKSLLELLGNVNASAPNGAAGMWLLDPNNVTIQAAGVNTNVTASPNFTTTDDNAIVTTGSIVTALNAGTSVTVTTASAGTNSQAGNITVANAIGKTAGGNATLTLNASNDITFNAGANVTSTVGTLGLTLNASGAINTLRNVNLNGGTLTLNAAGNGSQAAGTTIQGTTALVKQGAGTFTLSQANTYTGLTTINAGTLQYGVNNALASGAVTVNDGGIYDLNGFSDTIGALTVNSGVTGGSVTTGAGTLTLGGNVASTGGATNASISGNLGLGAATRTFTTTAAADGLSVSAVISGAVGLTKAGAGTLTLSGANTYTGATTMNAGVLSVDTLANGGVASSIGQSTNAAANLVLGGGTLQYTGGTVSTDRNYTLTAATTKSINVTTATTNLTISGASTATTGALTKAGAGTLNLSGANLYTGLTTINAGTLQYGISNALATGAVTVNDGGIYDLNGFSDTIGALTVNSGVTGGSVTTGAGTLTLGGNVTSTGGATNASISGNLGLGAATRTFTTTAAADGLSVSAIISGAVGLTKAGAGTLTLSGANTYTGVTTVNAGVIDVQNNTALGTTAGATTVASGAALQIDGSGLVIAEPITILIGTGIGGTGALRNLANNNTWSGAIALGAAAGARINSDGGTLTLSGAITGATRPLTVGGAGDTAISGVIGTTSGTLTKTGSGTLTLSGANLYTGLTTVSTGTLQYGVNNALATGAVTVNDGGIYDLNGFSDTIGALTVNSGVTGGSVTTGAGTLTLGGNVTSTGGATNASISGNLGLGAATRTFTTTAAADGLSVSATISGAVGLTKAGAGTLTLSGANTYTGVTTVNAGVIDVQNNTALGTTAGATTVASGAALQIDGSGLVIAEPITILIGTGIGGTGALRNLANNNTWSGAIALGAAAGARINSDGGTLTLSGAITGATRPLTVGGAGDTAISGVIGTTTGTLTKDGAGTLTLSTSNTYTGLTTVSTGTLALTVNNALGTNATGTTVASGATLDVQNVNYATTEGLTLNGGTLATSTGTSTFAGAVTLGAATTSTASVTGTQLTMSGTLDGAGGLDIAGTGTLVLGNALGITSALATVDQSATVALNINGGLVRTVGNQTYNGTLTTGGATTLRTTSNGDVSVISAINATAGALTLDIGTGNASLTTNTNDFSTVNITNAGTVSLVDANALSIGGITATGLVDVRTQTGDLTLNGAIATNSTSTNAVTLVAAVTSVPDATGTGGNFKNPGSNTITTGAGGAWRIYTGNPTGTTRGGLVEAGKRYNVDDGSDPIASGTRIYFRIQPTLTVTADAGQGKVYGDADPTLTYVTSGTLIDGDATFSPTGSLTRAVGETVAGGPYAIAAGTLSSQVGYTLNFVGDNFAITQRPVTVTADAGQNKVYGDADPASYTYSNTSLGTGVALVGSLTRAAGEPVGSYAITQGGLTNAANANYTINYVGDNFAITQRPVTVTADAGQNKVYGDADPASYTYSNTSLGTGVALVGSLTRAAGEPVGSYAITQGGLTNAANSNYTITYVGDNFAITQRPVTVTADAGQNKVYGDADPASYTYSNTSLGTGVALVGSLTRAAGEPVGSYAITQGGLTNAANTNYTITYVGDNFAITPAPLVIQADDKSRVTGVPNPPFTATYSGFVSGETPAVLTGPLSFTTPATTASPPGAYAITPFGQTSGNYTITYVNGNLTVNGVPTVSLPLPQAIENDLLRPQFVALQRLGKCRIAYAGRELLTSPPWGGVTDPAAKQQDCLELDVTGIRPRTSVVWQ